MSGERVIEVTDASIGLLAFIVIDDDSRARAFGGIRRARYVDADAAVADARRLAQAMTEKLALAELDVGGAKTVIADGPQLDVEAGYRLVGTAVDALAGRYVCGPDVGTGSRELEVVRGQTSFVNPAGNDAGLSTAKGVFAAVRGLCAHQFASPDPSGRSFAIEGFGAVGQALARMLIDAGATVCGHDIEAGARAKAEALGVHLVDDAEALTREVVDVFVPCALGSTLTPSRVEQLSARAVCGSANNQLSSDDVADRLRARGIVWVPDVLSSIGAVLEGVLTFGVGRSVESLQRVDEGIAAVEPRVHALLDEAKRRGESPLITVRRRVAERGR